MKSLQILPSLDVGGVERGVIDLARSMKSRGEEMIVVSSGGPLVAELNKIGVTHYELPVHKKSLFSLRMIPRLVEIIQQEHVDLVHARSRVPAWLAWFACRKAQVPFVTTCHGYYSTHLLSRVMGWGKRVIVISRIIGRHMIDDFGVPPDRIRLIHRGIDLSHFRFFPDKYDAVKKVPRIVNVGRLSPIKGHIEFLKAVHLLRKEIPNVEVWIVGSAGQDKHRYEEKLKATLEQLGLQACVRLVGKRRDIPAILKDADLLVLSTLVPEAFGRVIVEAGAVGTAVVATRVGGVMDIIDDGENGRLVPPGDVKGMAHAMTDLLKDRKLCRLMAHRLRAKIESCFSLEMMTDKNIEVYREVKEEKKILILKLGALGDVILATPSFKMIRERYPDAFVSLLVDKKLAPLISQSTCFDEVIPVDRKKIPRLFFLLRLAKKIRREQFDVSVDLQNSKWTHLLAFLGGVRKRFGFRRGKMAGLLNRAEPFPKVPEAPVKNQFRILQRMGVKKFHDELELPVDAQSEEKMSALLAAQGSSRTCKWVGFVVGSSPKWLTKRWPAASFAQLASRLDKELGCRVLLIGAAEDQSCAEEVRRLSSCPVLDLTGKTTPRELVALMKRMDVLVSGDTAPLHVAAALGTRIVALFGPTDSRRHMPPARHATVHTRHLSCQPCYKGICHNRDKLACLTRISVDEIFESVKTHLKPELQSSR